MLASRKIEKVASWECDFYHLFCGSNLRFFGVKNFEKICKNFRKNPKNPGKIAPKKKCSFLSANTHFRAPPWFWGKIGLRSPGAAGHMWHFLPFFPFFGQKSGQKAITFTFSLKNLIPFIGHIFWIFGWFLTQKLGPKNGRFLAQKLSKFSLVRVSKG